MVRDSYQVLQTLESLNLETLIKKTQSSDIFMNQGITFTVYSEEQGIERIFPLI
jgi:uncharacterized circularly permuted ATP-grasp superfamily protein